MIKDQTKIIFFGDVDSYLADIAKQHDQNAFLLDSDNCDDFLQSQRSRWTAYTSLGDLPKHLSKVYDILARADCIMYCPPTGKWSDHIDLDMLEPNASVHGLSETMLRLLPDSVKIYGLPETWTQDPIKLVDQRCTDQSQLWIVGCSISHGYAIDADQRFGALLAKELQIPCSFLTRPGSALDWAADQILRSDIRPGDTVVWGITAWCRLTHVHQHQLLKGITIRSFDHHPEYHDILNIDDLFSQQTFYKGIYAIQQVTNYCHKIGARLFLVGLMQTNFALLQFLQSQKNYIHIPYQIQYQNGEMLETFVDLATDLVHLGPKQNQIYKDIILARLTQFL